MKNIFHGDRSATWSLGERTVVRILAIFVMLIAVPIAPQYWRQLFSHHVAGFQVLFDLVNYLPDFFSAPKWGIASFTNMIVILAVSTLSGVLWANWGHRSNDADLYDIARIALRYKLAFALLSYGIVKFFPLQFPHLTLSDLNTNYGDFLPWKIYYLSNSAAGAGYQRTLGAFEIISGILLLWRRFSSIGAGIAIAALVDIVLVNFAYQLGDHVYAILLLLIAAIILANDAPRLVDLLILRRPAKADRFQSRLQDRSAAISRTFARAAVILFFFGYTAATYASYRRQNLSTSDGAGLPSAEGLYNVAEFSINGNLHPYSIVDPVRWQNVVFERWNTISIRSNQPLVLQVARPNLDSADIHRYEVAGNGGRQFFSYTFNEKMLHLTGTNTPGSSLSLNYQRNANGEIVLNGTDEQGNKLHAVLKKVNKTYLLNEGRRKPLTIY
jgi:hypothetical protein